MKILQVSTAEIGGGAEKIAYNLYREYQARGRTSWLAVGRRSSTDANIYSIPLTDSKSPVKNAWVQFNQKHQNKVKKPIFYLLKMINFGMSGRDKLSVLLGWEDFCFPGSHQLLSLVPERPDVVHFHNLHGGYFDLRLLEQLSLQLPVVITMHDEWLYTGHCAYSFNCERWMHGCGKCPDLRIYPSIYRDATAYNWQRKQKIYEKSQVYTIMPSRWLYERVQRSMFHPIESRMIHNGVDTRIFSPGESIQAREELNIPKNAKVILVVGNLLKESPFKDYNTVIQAITRLKDSFGNDRTVVITLGGEKGQEAIGDIPVFHFPYESDEKKIANYYRAADVLIQSSRTDNFPTTVLEAFACGTPVIGTAVGGIVEQIQDGANGYLVLPYDPEGMAHKIEQILQDQDLQKRMSIQARKVALEQYDIKLQVDAHFLYYSEILDQWSALNEQPSR